MTAKWMLRRTGNFSAGFEFWAVSLFKLMHNLEDSLRTGQPPLNLYEWIETQPEASRSFQEWMVAIAGFAGDEILKHVPVPSGARRLLDVGGGHTCTCTCVQLQVQVCALRRSILPALPPALGDGD